MLRMYMAEEMKRATMAKQNIEERMNKWNCICDNEAAYYAVGGCPHCAEEGEKWKNTQQEIIDNGY